MDAAGELDCHLKPIVRDGYSDSEDEEEDEVTARGVGAKTEGKKQLYPNKVWMSQPFLKSICVHLKPQYSPKTAGL